VDDDDDEAEPLVNEEEAIKLARRKARLKRLEEREGPGAVEPDVDSDGFERWPEAEGKPERENGDKENDNIKIKEKRK